MGADELKQQWVGRAAPASAHDPGVVLIGRHIMIARRLTRKEDILMGYLINIEGDFSRVDLSQLEGYLQEVVQEATGDPMSRVIHHSSVNQTPDDKMRQLRRMERAE